VRLEFCPLQDEKKMAKNWVGDRVKRLLLDKSYPGISAAYLPRCFQRFCVFFIVHSKYVISPGTQFKEQQYSLWMETEKGVCNRTNCDWFLVTKTQSVKQLLIIFQYSLTVCSECVSITCMFLVYLTTLFSDSDYISPDEVEKIE
jgi:hypothetical protein